MFYAWRANQRGDDIRATYNFDMIGYVDVLPESIEVCGDTFCEPLLDHFIACADTYTTLLTRKRLGTIVGDDGSFSSQGYQAVGIIEDHPNVNPYLHTQGDTIGSGFNNLVFCTDVIRAGIAALASASRPLAIIETDNLIAHSDNLIIISPNPFSKKTSIEFKLPRNGNAEIEIFDPLGRLVKHFGNITTDRITWEGVDDYGNKLPGGVYFLMFTAGEYTKAIKVLVLR